MRRWVVGGVGTAALVFAAGSSWFMSSMDGLQVIDPVVDQAPAAPGPQALAPPLTADPAAPLALCTIADQPTADDPGTDWATIVVDATNALPASFEPPDLVPGSAAGFSNSDGDLVRQIVVADLGALRQAAQANGTPVVLISAYRSYAYQQGLFEQEVEEVGVEQAQQAVARAGHSEHQLGTTVDVLDPSTGELETTFAQTPAGQWLAANAHTFGFVLSYPDVPSERTCYEFEPWHLRYVGRDTSLAVHDSGLTLREWLLSH